MSIKSDDKELFRKIREIWNKIIELIGINNAKDFVKNTIDDANESIYYGRCIQKYKLCWR